MVTVNGELCGTPKGVEIVNVDTGVINTILMPVEKLAYLGHNVEDGVPVRVVVEIKKGGVYE